MTKLRTTICCSGAYDKKLNMHRLPRHKQIKVFEGFAGYSGATFRLRHSGGRHKVIGYS